jgi:hypothetical protein
MSIGSAEAGNLNLEWKRTTLIQDKFGGAFAVPSGLVEFLRILSLTEAPYLIIGGFAMRLLGFPRYPKDYDIWISPRDQDACSICKAIQLAGLDLLGMLPTDLISRGRPNFLVQAVHAFSPIQLDLRLTVDGIQFEQAWSQAERVANSLTVVSLPDLVRIKQASNRPIDHDDLLILMEKRPLHFLS